MDWPTMLTPGKLIRRYKRFLADVELADGAVVTAHVPNTGSMLGTREPGSAVALSSSDSPTRKYPWTLELVEADGCWVGVNTSRTNGIVEEAIGARRLGPLRGYPVLRREVPYGEERSRIDLMLEDGDRRCYVEVKNVTYKVGGRALFPDAVTERGAKHLRELEAMVDRGHRGVVLFLVNRDDCGSMGPAREIDPGYGQLLDEVVAGGVEALAYRVSNTLERTVIDRKLKVIL